MGKMSAGAVNAAEYVAFLRGWRKKLVTALNRKLGDPTRVAKKPG